MKAKINEISSDDSKQYPRGRKHIRVTFEGEVTPHEHRMLFAAALGNIALTSIGCVGLKGVDLLSEGKATDA